MPKATDRLGRPIVQALERDIRTALEDVPVANTKVATQAVMKVLEEWQFIGQEHQRGPAQSYGSQEASRS